MHHFGLEWWWQYWCGLMTFLVVSNALLDTVDWFVRWKAIAGAAIGLVVAARMDAAMGRLE